MPKSMSRTIRIHVNRNRIASNLKTEREDRDDPDYPRPVCRVEDYEDVEYGHSIDVCCAECGNRVLSLISKWARGKRLSCGATVYLETDSDRADVTVHDQIP